MNGKITITGIQELQRANLKAISELKTSGAFGRAIIYATSQAHRYAVAFTHVDSGALRAAHRIEIHPSGLHGSIYIDPSAINPKGQKPSMYGIYEHARGGAHAFYQRVEQERGQEIANAAGEILRQALYAIR